MVNPYAQYSNRYFNTNATESSDDSSITNDWDWNYSMIWFLKLLLRSLCGRTMELSMITSDGIFTLQPDEMEREALRSHIRWITFKYTIYSWWCSIKLPRIVMDGVSFPSLNSVSLSILAYGSLGFGSLGVPSTLAHLPMVLPQPTILFNTQLWSYRTRS